jgi:hypothetical protein
MHIGSPEADEWARVPEALREVLRRVEGQATHSAAGHCTVQLDICDSDLSILSALEFSGPESLQMIQQQAAELGYRSLRLAGVSGDGSPRLLLVRNRDAERR